MAAKKSARKAPRKTSKKTASKKAPVMKKAASGAGLTSVKAHMAKLDHKVAALDEKISRTNAKVRAIDDAAGKGFEILNSRITNVENGLAAVDAALGNVMNFGASNKRRANIATFAN